ncbi:MAG: hypothetical protein VX265_06555 [Myxococcota bacterium]|nr:hypothetical protein [Myxococcota bacterium]
MIRALGYSLSVFDPSDPGRLCRGRERWIDAYPLDEDPGLSRLVISGALFSDDSARDAQRGLSFSGLTIGGVIRALYPDAVLVACAEDAHPREVPAGARGLETYDLRVPGGPLHQWAVRWSLVCETAGDIDDALEAGAECLLVLDAPLDDMEDPQPTEIAPVADGHVDPDHGGGLPKAWRERVYLLMGHRTDGPPARLFQATSLPDLLDHSRAVVLVHQDKHARCAGVYARELPQSASDVLSASCAAVGALAVPFAIPPMLARWDRALWELRQHWDPETLGDYPVPPAEDVHYGWARRRRGNRLRQGEE